MQSRCVEECGKIFHTYTLKTVRTIHRCKCGKDVDQNGYHGLSCKSSSGRHPRHHALNETVRRALVSAGIFLPYVSHQVLYGKMASVQKEYH